MPKLRVTHVETLKSGTYIHGNQKEHAEPTFDKSRLGRGGRDIPVISNSGLSQHCFDAKEVEYCSDSTSEYTVGSPLRLRVVRCNQNWNRPIFANFIKD